MRPRRGGRARIGRHRPLNERQCLSKMIRVMLLNRRANRLQIFFKCVYDEFFSAHGRVALRQKFLQFRLRGGFRPGENQVNHFAFAFSSQRA